MDVQEKLGPPVTTPKGRELKPGATGESKKVVDASGDGKVLKYILEEGDMEYTPDHPSDTADVRISIEGRIKDGPEFMPLKELVFILGAGDTVVEGVELAVYTMRKSEKARVTVHYDYAYGHEGIEGVPPDTDVVFTISVIDYSSVVNFGNMAPKEKLGVLRHDRDMATALFRLGKYRMASKKYDKVIQAYSFVDVTADDKDPYKSEAIELRKGCLLNRALVMMKMGRWNDCIHVCTEVTESEGEEFNAKALLRRGRAYTMVFKYDEARSDFKTVLEHHSDAAKEVERELGRLNEKIRREKLKERKMFKGVFKKMAAMPEEVEDKTFLGRAVAGVKKLSITIITVILFAVLAIIVGNISRGKPITSGLNNIM